MAEDEIVIVEEDGDVSPESEAPEQPKEGFWSKKKITLIAIAGGITVALLALTTIIILSGKTADKKVATEAALAKEGEAHEEKSASQLTKSEVERLIEKAKTMYDSGNKENALKIYAQISLFNESLSNYNLGVSKMSEADYSGALRYFDNALTTKDNELPSAINAAVCSLFMGDKAAFTKYIARAKEALPRYTAKPLYSYYYTLLNYYDGRYMETLASLSNPTSDYFAKEQAAILPRLYHLFGDTDKTIAALKKTSQDSFAIGLLEARAGRYDKAAEALLKAKDSGSDPIKTNMALALVYLKLGQMTDSIGVINGAASQDPVGATMAYPIDVTLKEGLYASEGVQRQIADSFFGSLSTQASQIFYYAPYKIFNPNRTISSIKKGQLGLMLDNAPMGREYLENAAKSSSANEQLVRGISYALGGHISLANKSFKELAKKFTNHGVLEYNLALTYAQLGEYREAQKRFAKAYSLDSNNYEAGNLAMLCGRLLGINTDRVKGFLAEELLKKKDDENALTNLALFAFVTDTPQTAAQWLATERKGIAMNFLLAALLQNRLGQPQKAVLQAQKLVTAMPGDVVAASLALYLENKTNDPKIYARNLQKYLNENKIDMNAIYYNADIAYKSFVEISRISGLLARGEAIIQTKAGTEKYDGQQLQKAMSLLALYLQNYESAYTNYTKLVQEFGVTNPEQLFLAGLASVGSRHSSDAISYFELSKLVEANNPETLYALGLLYQEAGNLNQAAAQYKQIKTKFNSDYFDFAIQVRQ